MVINVAIQQAACWQVNPKRKTDPQIAKIVAQIIRDGLLNPNTPEIDTTLQGPSSYAPESSENIHEPQ